MPKLARPVWAAIAVVILLAGLWWFLPTTVSDPASSIEFEYTEKVVGRSTSDDKTPLVIALHGNGDTPKDFFESLLVSTGSVARIILVRAPFKYTGGRLGGTAWPSKPAEVAKYGDALAGAIRVLSEKFGSAGKPVVTGFSGGAEMAYYLAAEHNREYSFILPISGRLSYPGIGDHLGDSGAAIIAFHARDDEVIPYVTGTTAAKVLGGRGVSVEWHDIEGGHQGVFKKSKALYLERLRWALQRTRLAP